MSQGNIAAVECFIAQAQVKPIIDLHTWLSLLSENIRVDRSDRRISINCSCKNFISHASPDFANISLSASINPTKVDECRGSFVELKFDLSCSWVWRTNSLETWKDFFWLAAILCFNLRFQSLSFDSILIFCGMYYKNILMIVTDNRKLCLYYKCFISHSLSLS